MQPTKVKQFIKPTIKIVESNKENSNDININHDHILNEMRNLLKKAENNTSNSEVMQDKEIKDDTKINITNSLKVLKEEKLDSLKRLIQNYEMFESIEKQINKNKEIDDDQIMYLNKQLNDIHDSYSIISVNQIKEDMETDFICQEKLKKMQEISNSIKDVKKNNLMINDELLNCKTDLKYIQNERLNIESNVLDYESQIQSLEAMKLNMLNQQAEVKKRIEDSKRQCSEVEKANSNYIDYLKLIHNQLLENKGNIRVFCRVRPLLSKEKDKIEEAKKCSTNIVSKTNTNISSKNLSSVVSDPLKGFLEYQDTYLEFSGTDKLIVNGPVTKSNIGKLKDNQTKDIYYFDRVFPHETVQSAIFEEISQLVQSALDGYKVCIFAYGQTGSGKTFTMEGDKLNPGIIPRSIHKIFNTKSTLQTLGWTTRIFLSYYEIYMEQIQDLLSKNKGFLSQYDIKDIESIEVFKIEDVLPLLDFACKNRTKAETNCNEKSSRSHSICQLKITSKNTETNQVREGALNLIDLAGSERIAQSKVEGEKFKETVSINKSLTTLKSVISALNNGQSKFVPYRESPLTYVLQQYLGGDSKTLMFVNISPIITQINETTSSLKFATEVNSCKIN
jgi:kinesin family protein C1